MQNVIKTYLRKPDKTPFGVAVMIRSETGEKLMGYSLCSPKDRFDKKLGTVIALRRATDPSLKPQERLAPLVADRRELVCGTYKELEKRASKYFKQDYSEIV